MYLYQPLMYQTYFDVAPENITTVSLYDLWHPTLCDGAVIKKLNDFLNININMEVAQDLQKKWWQGNFNFEFSSYERNVYKVKKQ